MPTNTLTVLVTLMALSSLSVVAQTQEPRAKTDKAATPVTGSIKGRVVNESGQPLPNAAVSARGANGNESQSVATDRDGTFQINDLEQGTAYYISAQLPAYVTSPRERPASTATTYRVGDSVTLTLVKGAVITGTVTNAAGEPVAGIRVRMEKVVRDRNGKRLPSDGPWGDRQTDDRGVYRIYGVPAGTYVVMAGGPSQYYSSSTVDPYESDVPTYANSATRDAATEITVRAGEETSGVDIRYRAEQGRTISGVVTGAGRGFSVVLSSAGDVVAPWNASTYQQLEDNSFSFIGLADGDYDLYAYSHAGNREYSASEVKRIRLRGADVTGIELAPRPLASVAGRVVLEETQPPECTEKARASFDEITVGAWHYDSEQAKETPQSLWSLGAPAKPDAQGSFLIRNLVGADYYFGVRTPAINWYVRSIQLTGAGPAKKPVDVTGVWTNIKTGDRLSGLTFTLAQGAASFHGQLVLGEGEKVLPRTYVYLIPAERERSENPWNYFGTGLAVEGKFGMTNIPPGRYWIFAETISDGAAVIKLTRLRFPHGAEIRTRLRRAAEAAKNEITLRPCQEVGDFKLYPKSVDQ